MQFHNLISRGTNNFFVSVIQQFVNSCGLGTSVLPKQLKKTKDYSACCT